MSKGATIGTLLAVIAAVVIAWLLVEFVFHLAVPSLDDPLSIKGKVQWIVTEAEANESQEPGMGIGFVYDSEIERDRIANTVETLMVQQLGPVLYEKLMRSRPT